MQPVRFIHAADLHLDTAFPGLARNVSPELSGHLHKATFTALDRLVALCEREKPDFLILAGDTWNQEDLSLKAQLAMRGACERLERSGIRVFMAHGNHDPLTSRLQALEWPANVTVFQDKVDAFPVFRDELGQEVLAVVHGISHTGPAETRNLAAWFQRVDHECPQIGVLHTSLGTEDGEAVYAPASLEDLAASGLDYWALGHVHEYTVACESPLAVYPGAAQGLHIGETGPHGCVVVTLTPEAGKSGTFGGVSCECRFEALAPVCWHILDLDLGGLAMTEEEQAHRTDAPDTLSRLERLLRDKLSSLAGNAWEGCETVVVRIRLSGRTPLDGELRRAGILAELTDILQEGEADGIRIWVKDIQVDTRPVFDRDAASLREDLLGELLRRADMWRGNEKVFLDRADEALADLFVRGRLRKGLSQPHKEELYDLLAEAERLCADFLESEG